jgi:hypothetical protein
MVRATAFTVLAAAATSLAAPSMLQRDDAITDVQVLQFAQTLEHLENTFYEEALGKLDDQAFEAAGYPPWVRARFEQIRGHEATHVEFLAQALGDDALLPCIYNFPYNDPKSFAALAMALETVGASAYIGASRLLKNKDTLIEAASILGVESRQAAWISSAVLKGSAWDGPFETPLSPDGVFSIASQFIVSCPASNPPLPVKALPKLELQPGSPQPGDSVKFQFKSDEVRKDDSPLFVAFFDGVTVQYADLNGDNSVVVPQDLQGTVYAAIVNNKADFILDQELLTGLVMFEVGFPSYVDNV